MIHHSGEACVSARDDLSIDGDLFRVLINGLGQHSIWPAGQKIPDGWNNTGPIGAKDECLAWIKANWTDMRPRAAR